MICLSDAAYEWVDKAVRWLLKKYISWWKGDFLLYVYDDHIYFDESEAEDMEETDAAFWEMVNKNKEVENRNEKLYGIDWWGYPISSPYILTINNGNECRCSYWRFVFECGEPNHVKYCMALGVDFRNREMMWDTSDKERFVSELRRLLDRKMECAYVTIDNFEEKEQGICWYLVKDGILVNCIFPVEDYKSADEWFAKDKEKILSDDSFIDSLLEALKKMNGV